MIYIVIVSRFISSCGGAYSVRGYDMPENVSNAIKLHKKGELLSPNQIKIIENEITNLEYHKDHGVRWYSRTARKKMTSLREEAIRRSPLLRNPNKWGDPFLFKYMIGDKLEHPARYSSGKDYYMKYLEYYKG